MEKITEKILNEFHEQDNQVCAGSTGIWDRP